jgi:hypothetical protein
LAVRATQIVASISVSDVPFVLVTQIVVAVATSPIAGVFATQVGLSAATAPLPVVRVSNLALSIMVWTHEVPMPALYPTLPGLGYSVIKRPRFYGGIGKSATGREVRVAYAVNPTWEWDLTYDYLPDQQTDSSATASDLKELIGFFLSQTGTLQAFRFLDPDDNQVSGQLIGETDGVTTAWVLQRSFGGSSGVGTEPIGWLNTDLAFNVYLDGALQDPASYDRLLTAGVFQQIRFHATPAAGKVISVDMHYYFSVRFSADTYDFEKFMDKLWSTQTITLVSQRD